MKTPRYARPPNSQDRHKVRGDCDIAECTLLVQGRYCSTMTLTTADPPPHPPLGCNGCSDRRTLCGKGVGEQPLSLGALISGKPLAVAHHCKRLRRPSRARLNIRNPFIKGTEIPLLKGP